LSNRPDQRLPLIYVSPGLYVSAHATWSHARSGLGAGTLDEPQSIARLRTDLRAAQVIALNRRWRLRFDGVGRWWPRHEQLVAGDEWYLGGEGWLQGYSDRDVVAASGWVLVSELMCDLAREVAAAAFAETGLLTGFAAPDGRTVRPSSYGIAIMLHSRQRYGRLQVAWRDGAAWGDGLIRLNVSHGW
jgi:hemolysin activation/secretion protein